MRRGFTLVELAIVLIIIGLVVASALKTTEIIGNAKAKKNVTEITKLADAQHTFYERTGRYAGDSDNDSDIDHTVINVNTFPVDTNPVASTNMAYPFNELEDMGILPTQTNSIHATLTEGGPAYFSGITVTDGADNDVVINMVVVRQVPCLTAYQMEISIDNSSPDAANSAATGRVRAINGAALYTSGAWISDICGNNPDTLTNLAYLFDRF